LTIDLSIESELSGLMAKMDANSKARHKLTDDYADIFIALLNPKIKERQLDEIEDEIKRLKAEYEHYFEQFVSLVKEEKDTEQLRMAN